MIISRVISSLSLKRYKLIVQPTPAQRVATRLKILEEKENRAPPELKDTPSSQEGPFLTQEQLFYEIQDREIGEEVAKLEKELENIRRKRVNMPFKNQGLLSIF